MVNMSAKFDKETCNGIVSIVFTRSTDGRTEPHTDGRTDGTTAALLYPHRNALRGDNKYCLWYTSIWMQDVIERHTDGKWTVRIYNHFVQGQENTLHCQISAVKDIVTYLWHKGGFFCPFTKRWLIIIPKPLFNLLRTSILILKN